MPRDAVRTVAHLHRFAIARVLDIGLVFGEYRNLCIYERLMKELLQKAKEGSTTPSENRLRTLASNSSEKPLLLCVEDDPAALALRKSVLEQSGYQVAGASTAPEALKVLSELPICATITDHMLQGITGLALAQEMKKIKPDVPIILYSGTPPDCNFNGADVFVNKNVLATEFLRVVREVIEHLR